MASIRREQFYKRRIAALSKHSTNSSKPPSSDTVRPPNPKQSGASRRHDGPPGHKGNNNIRWLKHLIFHSTAIILLSLCTGRIAIAQDSTARVSPSSGNTGTNFYWYVHYYDADGDWPDTKNVYIDGTSYIMSFFSGSESNGTYRNGPKNLGVGSHNYYFYFTDGQGGSARLPSSGTFFGPSVGQQVGIYHPADLNNDYVISMLEILEYHNQWALGNVTMLEVLEVMDLWSAGHYYWDESEQKFKPGEQP